MTSSCSPTGLTIRRSRWSATSSATAPRRPAWPPSSAPANAALIERHGPNQELVSAVCLRFTAPDSRITCAVAGHPLPLCLPSLEELRPEGPTFLLGAREDFALANAETRLEHSDGVLAYTDGVTDVRRGEDLLGVDGLARLLAPLTALPARALAREGHRALLGWADQPIGDDLCLLVLKPKGWEAD